MNFEPKPESKHFFKAFALALLGAMCGGVIFVAIKYALNITSIFFFILNGLGAYAFWEVFMHKEEQRKTHVLMVLLADVISVFITLFVYFGIVSEFVTAREGAGFGIWKAYFEFMFSSRGYGIIFWAFGIVLAIGGTFLAKLLYVVFSNERFEKKKRNRKRIVKD